MSKEVQNRIRPSSQEDRCNRRADLFDVAKSDLDGSDGLSLGKYLGIWINSDDLVADCGETTRDGAADLAKTDDGD